MRQLITIIRSKSDILFILLLLILGFHYNYQEIVVKPPHSVHVWRQVDCASIAYNYYQNGMNFFHPEMHNLMSDDLTTGCNIGECPLINYFVAFLYKIFGFNDFWYRLVVLIIYFSGLFALYKSLELIIKSKFWSICLSLLFFASPNLVYYGNNFISDSPAFSFSLIGWYFFFKFYYKSRKKHIILSILFFTIATLIKVTAGMSVIAIIGLYIIELFNWTKFKNGISLFVNKKFFIFPLLLFILIVFSWYLFSINYNQFHKNPNYFLTNIKPIWTMSSADIDLVIYNVLNIWHKIYFDISVLIFLLVCFLLNIFYLKKINVMLGFLLFAIFIGTILFIVLWFFVFRDHDYYAINLYILPVFVIITFFELISKYFKYLLDSKIIRIFFIVFLIFNVNYTKGIINDRYCDEPSNYPYRHNMSNIASYMKSIGINKNDKIIVFNDFTTNYMLYLTNVTGWTRYNSTFDSTSISKFINKGAKYLLLWQKENIDPSINSFLTNKVGVFENFSIFRLDGSKVDNYPLNYKEVLESDLENASSDFDFFLTKPNNLPIPGAKVRSNEIYHSGKQSILLDGINNNFGLTFMLNVIPGKTYYASVWSYSMNGTGHIVVNDTTGQIYRREEKVISLKSKDGWGLLEISFTIPTDFPFKKVGVYVWNPSGYPVYFDDFRIMESTFKLD